MSRDRETDQEIVIVGGGIAGAALAFALAERGVEGISLLEREPTPGYHASGRSAAALTELDFDPAIQRLLALGGRFLRSPPPGFASAPLLDASGSLELLDAAGADELARVERILEEARTDYELWDPAEVRRRLPVVAGGDFARGVWMPACGRIAVDRLLAGYLDRARAGGVEIATGAEVTGVVCEAGRVAGVETRSGVIRARWVVNAAGAWAGALARAAAASPIPLVAYRRTIVTFDPPPGVYFGDWPGGWPLTCYEARGIYFGPEGDRLLASPMDEEPLEPGDARPDPRWIETALDRLGELAPALRPARPGPARAGLRTFAPDRRLVVGPDPSRPGFFWLAGLGGWGIETSAATGRLAAALLTGDGGGGECDLAGAFSPARFA